MDFKKEVVDLSFELPVVVDFWAPWCGPCQFLGPVIEELAASAGGKWKLVKVNVDDNPEVSAEYSIRGIPDVRMFHKGKVVAAFTGALPRHQIEKWLGEHLPDERKEELERIMAEVNENPDSGISKLKKFVDKNPDLPEASLSLAEYLVFKDHEKALQTVQPHAGQAKYLDRVENIKALARLMACDREGNGQVQEKIDLARKAVKRTDFDEALKTLIEAVMIDKSYCNELPRQATIAVFRFLGENHELTKKYRRRFNMALY